MLSIARNWNTVQSLSRPEVDRRALVRVKLDADSLFFPKLGSLGDSRVQLERWLANLAQIRSKYIYKDDLHSHNAVVTSRGKHARVSRVPRDGIHTALRMSLQNLHKGAILLVPNVDMRICRAL